MLIFFFHGDINNAGVEYYNLSKISPPNPNHSSPSCFLRSRTNKWPEILETYPLIQTTYLLLLPSLSMMVMTGTQLSLCLRELNALLWGSSISSPYSVLTSDTCSCGASSWSRRKAKMGDSISWTRESISLRRSAVISMSANFCTRLEACS